MPPGAMWEDIAERLRDLGPTLKTGGDQDLGTWREFLDTFHHLKKLGSLATKRFFTLAESARS